MVACYEETLYEDAVMTFKDTKIKITSAEKRHLGAVIGPKSSKEDYI